MPNKVSVAIFGAGQAGLATVGYTIYNPDSTVKNARTTTGVSELGTSTGIYRATIAYDPNFKGMILWDTGGGSPRYAAESINPIDADSVADEMRMLLRSLNTSLSSHLERLFKNGVDFSKIEKRLDKMNDGVDKIDVKPQVSFQPIIDAINNYKAQLDKERVLDQSRISDSIQKIRDYFDGKSKASGQEVSKQMEELKKLISNLLGSEDVLIDKMLDKFKKKFIGEFASHLANGSNGNNNSQQLKDHLALISGLVR